MSTICRQLERGVLIRKSSIRYFNETAVRAIWDRDGALWLYSAVDVVSALTDSKNPRVYWNTCKRRNPELNAFCRQLRLTASDGKAYLSDCICQRGVDALVMVLPGKYRSGFAEWIEGKLCPLDEQSWTSLRLRKMAFSFGSPFLPKKRLLTSNAPYFFVSISR